MRVSYETVERLDDGRFKVAVLVNHKRQGCFIETPATNEKEWSAVVDGDKYNKIYTNKHEVIIAVCAKNGRKIKWENGKWR